MTTLREAAQQALETLEGVDARCITSGYVGMDGQYLKVVVAARGEWQGYTWNPYAISQPKAEPLTDEEIYECERIAATRYHRHKNSIRGQQITPADDPQWHFVRAIIAAYERKNGIGEQP